MKKIILALLVCSSLTFAATKDWYVGVGVYRGDAKVVDPVTELEVDYDSAGGADIKFGMIFADNNRLEVTSTVVNLNKSGVDSELVGNDFVWIWTSNLNNANSIFIPFISAGFGNYKVGDTNVYRRSINAGLGALLQIKENVAIEFSAVNKVIIGETTNDNLDYRYIGVRYNF